MKIEQNLTAVWHKAIREGHIRNRFRDAAGRTIEVGLRLVPGGPAFYATDLATGHEIGADVLERAIEGWSFTIQWNQYRSLKPHVRPKGFGRQADFSPDVSDCFFACQDPGRALSLLRRNALLQLTFAHHKWAGFYNALPVEKEGHFLWLPIRTDGALTVYPHWLQVLSRPFLEDFLALGRAGTDTLTTFNSLHAGASVNHLHYHTICQTGTVAMEKAPVVSAHGYRLLEDYPACALFFEEPIDDDQLWACIAKLQSKSVPMNVIYCRRKLYVFARNIDHEFVEEFPDAVMAFMELIGRPITTDESYYGRADRHLLQAAYSKTTLDRENLLNLLR